MKTYAILPYRELVDIALEASDSLGLQLKAFEGHVEEAVPLAREAEKEGARIIISRGGTAEILKRHVKIPVIEIRVSDLDLLRVLYPLKGMDKQILVVGFRNAVYRARSVARVLGLKIHELPVPYEETDYNFDAVKYSAERLIARYNIDTIIGDQTAYVNLQSFCESKFLITSGIDDVMEALTRTADFLPNSRPERDSRTVRIEQVLDNVHEAILVLDENGRITSFNTGAERMFEMSRNDVLSTGISQLLQKKHELMFLGRLIQDVSVSGSPEEITVSADIAESRGVLLSILIAPLLYAAYGSTPKGIILSIRSSSPGENNASRKQSAGQRCFGTRYTFDDILTSNNEIIRIVRKARSFSASDATLLIEGESGVGKEIFAQSIHAESSRCKSPFVAVNCAAIPLELLESELFGYEKGAFTGAREKGKKGLFELADGGTLFLDEINEISPKLQTSLLRVLEEKQIFRIGSDRMINIDVRIIAASNRKLKTLVADGSFREDLYYRLNLLKLTIPPLRERKEDIPLLAQHFFSRFRNLYNGQKCSLPDEIPDRLTLYTWPGNVRELRNIMERLALVIDTECIDPGDTASLLREIDESIEEPEERDGSTSKLETMEEIKRRAAIKALTASGNNKSDAARRLNIDRSTLDRLIGDNLPGGINPWLNSDT